jgi:hypothetical protein
MTAFDRFPCSPVLCDKQQLATFFNAMMQPTARTPPTQPQYRAAAVPAFHEHRFHPYPHLHLHPAPSLRRRIIVGISGRQRAVYGARSLQVLQIARRRRTWWFQGRLAPPAGRIEHWTATSSKVQAKCMTPGPWRRHRQRFAGSAAVHGGSQPCSMRTPAVAHGPDNLLTRAADDAQ